MHISFQSDKTHFSFSICFASKIDERVCSKKILVVTFFDVEMLSWVLHSYSHMEENSFAEFFALMNDFSLSVCVCLSLFFVIFLLILITDCERINLNINRFICKELLCTQTHARLIHTHTYIMSDLGSDSKPDKSIFFDNVRILNIIRCSKLLDWNHFLIENLRVIAETAHKKHANFNGRNAVLQTQNE